jgi:hypothetical protein
LRQQLENPKRVSAWGSFFVRVVVEPRRAPEFTFLKIHIVGQSGVGGVPPTF